MEVVRVAVTVLQELNKFVEKTDIGHEVDFPKFHQTFTFFSELRRISAILLGMVSK